MFGRVEEGCDADGVPVMRVRRFPTSGPKRLTWRLATGDGYCGRETNRRTRNDDGMGIKREQRYGSGLDSRAHYWNR